VTKTDTFSTSSTSYTDITGATVTITPTSASSKIFVMANGHVSQDATGAGGFVQLVRGSTAINIGDASGSKSRASAFQEIQQQTDGGDFGFHFLDTPSANTATTYKLQAKAGTTGNAYIGRDGDATSNADRGVAPTTITVMEIMV
jgi:hypothetical protein